MFQAKLLLLLFAFLALISGIVDAQSFWIVAKDGTGQFTEIQPAINAADAGDVILVRNGSYGGVEITKAIRIVGAGVNQTTIGSGPGPANIYVHGVGEGLVVVSSLRIGNNNTGVRGLAFEGTGLAGKLVLDDVFAQAPPQITSGIAPPPAVPAIDVVSSSLCLLQAISANQGSSNSVGGDLIAGTMLRGGGIVSIVQSSFFGLNGAFGANASFPYSYPGQAALSASNPQCFLSNTICLGGWGGKAYAAPPVSGGLPCIYAPAQPGGSALIAGGNGSSYALAVGGTGSSFFGGVPGAGFTQSGCTNSAPASTVSGFGLNALAGAVIQYAMGSNFNKPTGSVTQVAAFPHSKLTSTVKLGQPYSVEYSGLPGDQVFILLADDADHLPVPGIEGNPLLVSPFAMASAWFYAGAFDAAGKLVISGVVPNDPTLRGGALFLQGLIASSTNAHPLQLTNVSYLIVRE